MTVFHLDGNCVYTLDGAPAPDAFERAERFALGGWMTGRAPTTVVVDPLSPKADGLRVTDFCNGHMLLSLNLEPLPLPHSKPLQCECSGAKRHLVTACDFENTPLVAETDGARHAVLCPVAAKSVTASCARVDGGDLIRIFAHGERTFCAVLFFCGDYAPLLALTADKIEFCDKEIVATDFVVLSPQPPPLSRRIDRQAVPRKTVLPRPRKERADLASLRRRRRRGDRRFRPRLRRRLLRLQKRNLPRSRRRKILPRPPRRVCRQRRTHRGRKGRLATKNRRQSGGDAV